MICNSNHNTSKRKFKHISEFGHSKIKTLLKESYSPAQIAKKLNKHCSTIISSEKLNVVLLNGEEQT